MCIRIFLDQKLHKTKMLRDTKTRFLLGLLTVAWFGSYILKWYMIVMSNMFLLVLQLLMWPVLMVGPPWSTGWLRGQNGQKRTSSLWSLKPWRALGCCYMQKASGTTASTWCCTKDSCCSTTNKVRWNFSWIVYHSGWHLLFFKKLNLW